MRTFLFNLLYMIFITQIRFLLAVSFLSVILSLLLRSLFFASWLARLRLLVLRFLLLFCFELLLNGFERSFLFDERQDVLSAGGFKEGSAVRDYSLYFVNLLSPDLQLELNRLYLVSLEQARLEG